MLMLALRLILKDKGGKQHCLIPFAGSHLGVEILLKKREHEKWMRWNRALRHLGILCIEISRKFYAKPVWFLFLFIYLFIYFLVIKGIVKALFSLIPWLLNFSDLPNYGLNSRKRYSLRLLSKCLVRSTLLPIGGKVPQLSDTLFDSLRWAPFSLALQLCSS